MILAQMYAGTIFKCLQTGSCFLWGRGETKNSFKRKQIIGKDPKIKFVGYSVTFTSTFDNKSDRNDWASALKYHQPNLIWHLKLGLGQWPAFSVGRLWSSSSSFLPDLLWEAVQSKIEAVINISWMGLQVYLAQTSPSASSTDMWGTSVLPWPS